ncbi:nascent polypeptide-associated complex protein [Candidatus Pacearchaeota archaeon]|nr:nascent polypeptide-associated complex protein [Candidatus Pacearchaeota archaeon]|tara:strand:+ start:900 stop:1235 length:336 start_codon:yes stop_codon:yes gene_type:complete
MIPGLGGMNPKKMAGMMKQMGIDQDEIDADRVEIFKKDGSKITVENAQVVRISMQGNESFQVTGDIGEGEAGLNEDDVKMVAEKTGKSENEAKKALEESEGDIAQAIVKLS